MYQKTLLNYFTLIILNRVHWRATQQSYQIHLPAVRRKLPRDLFIIMAVLLIIISVHVNCLFFPLIFSYVLNVFIDTFDTLVIRRYLNTEILMMAT